MENLKSFATPATYSYQVVRPNPSPMYGTKRFESVVASSSKSKINSSIKPKHSAAPPAFNMHQVAGNAFKSYTSDEQDPFINDADDDKNAKKLSPTATPFKPRQIADVTGIPMHQWIHSTPKNRIFETPSASSLASGKTSKEVDSPHTIQTTEGIFDYVFPAGGFACGRHTRYLSIHGIPENLTADSIIVLIKGKTYRAPAKIVEARRSARTVLLAFSNIVDSVNAAGEIPNKHSTWSVDFTNAREFAEEIALGSGAYISIHKGQLKIVATQSGPCEDFSEHDVLEVVTSMMKTYGAILAWELLHVTYPKVHVRMEYYDARDSETAKTALHGSVLGPLQLSVTDYAPDVVPAQPAVITVESAIVSTTIEDDLNTMVDALTFDKSGNKTSNIVGTPFAFHRAPRSDISATSDRTIMNSSHISAPNRHFTGPTPYSSGFPISSRHNIAANSNPGSFTSGYLVNQSNVSGSFGLQDVPQSVAPMTAYRMPYRSKRPAKMNYLGNNFVNPLRITQGQDVRTTIMLRNIPNKMPQSELKQYIDETSHGEYDFMYLRIDFANNCNVGYAFVNFVDPLAIVKFVNARAGTKWLRYHSDKVAEISYATIQGRDCLIQKFRNSSVMLEDPAFRPKLFHTSPGPMAGREESFPGPDNDSKLRRSIKNAGAVGLFAPRAGQVFRETQRRRRSQFDRGTNLAQIEESFVSENEYHSQVSMAGSRSAPSYHVKF